MIQLRPELARVLWPVSILPLIQSTGIINLHWDELKHITGSWMTVAGFDLEHGTVNIDEDGRLRGFGKHLGLTYNNDRIQVVHHKAGTTTRCEFDGEDYRLLNIATGPRCCTKPVTVRTIPLDDAYSQVITGPNGNDTIYHFDKHHRLTKVHQGRTTTSYTYDFGMGPSSKEERDQKYRFSYHGDTGLPASIEWDGPTTQFDIVQSVDGKTTGLHSGGTVLLDFTAFLKLDPSELSPAAKTLYKKLGGQL